jgi:hypothetical protein
VIRWKDREWRSLSEVARAITGRNLKAEQLQFVGSENELSQERDVLKNDALEINTITANFID